MRPIFALITLTWKAAFRYRLFWVLTILLLGAVVLLPALVKDDGTVEGFTQILLTYTLSAVTGILGMCALWLSCGTLARDIEDCQIQMVAVKPIARWQIWLGKWLGLLTLNATLLALSGAGIYALLEIRSKKLPADQQARLREEILVARASVKEASHDAEIEAEMERRFNERMKKNLMQNLNLDTIRAQLREQVKAEGQAIGPGDYRRWTMHLGAAKDQLKDRPLFVRVKFNTLDNSEYGTFGAVFRIGTEQKTRLYQTDVMSLAPNTFHEFPIPPGLIDDNGDLIIEYANPNSVALIFPLEDSMEVLYREGGFGLNYCRGLGIILCWITLLSTLGLAAASLLSFPVAAFFSLAILLMGFSSGTLSNVVSEGTLMGFNEETSQLGHSKLDIVAVPFFRALLSLIQLVQQFAPIDALSTGRVISWGQFGLAVGQIVFLMGGLMAAAGIYLFQRRELATAQGTH